MAEPGWYPDPAGVPGRFRHWDGRHWSAATTTDPSQPPPPGSPGGSGPPEQQPRRGALLVGVVVGAIALVLVVVFGIRALLPDDESVTSPPPSSTVSGWDETSRPDTPTPSPSPSDPSTTVECPAGDPGARTKHPDDGWVHGGGLTFPAAPGWEDTSGAGLSWAYDVGAMNDVVEPGWVSMVAVGALRMADGFETPQDSARMITQCLTTSDYYTHIDTVTEVGSAAHDVDGQPAWWIRTEITVDNPDLESTGDVLDVIVVDTQDGESLGMFVAAAPIGDSKRQTIVDDLTALLAVE